jgi:hypothetical protein
MVSTGDITNPARGHQHDICRRRLRWSSASDGSGIRSGLELHPGITPFVLNSGFVCFCNTVVGFSSFEGFPGLMHLPESPYEFLSHSNPGFALIACGSVYPAVPGCGVRILADKGVDCFAEDPPESRGALPGDMPLGDFTGAFVGSFGESGVAGDSICGVESFETGHFADNDSGRDVCDTGDGLEKNDIILESVHFAELKEPSSNDSPLSFEMFNGFQELGERELSHGREFIPLGKEPFLSGSSGDGFRAGEVVLYKDPAHSNFDVGHNFGGIVPVASESSELAEGFVRDEGFRDISFEEKLGDEFGIDFIGFGAFFAGSVPEFGGVGKDEFVDSGLEVFPEPFVHAD